MLQANLATLCVIEPQLLPIEVLHCGNKNLQPFCPSNLDLDPMTFIYKFDPYLVKVYWKTKNELHTSRLSQVNILQTDTDRRT